MLYDFRSTFPVQIPQTRIVYYLDTCVWGNIANSEAAQRGLISFCQSEQPALGLSAFTLFELSYPTRLSKEIDTLLFDLRQYVYIASIYDQVIEAELEHFPQQWKMKWLPMYLIRDFQAPNFVTILAEHALFKQSRERMRHFGLTRFKNLEDFKENFPPLYGSEWTVKDAPHFAWANALYFLERQFPSFLKRNWAYIRQHEVTSLDSLLSLRIRSLLLFMKYYLHGQSPQNSDFLDFAQVSYAPYCNVFVTEQNVGDVLRRVKSNGLMLENTDIVYVSDFIRRMEKYSRIDP